jgi:energy-coupling factor transport system permease protein
LALSKIAFEKFWNLTKLYIVPIAIGIVLLGLIFYQGALIDRFKEGLILAIRFSILICFGILFAMVTNPIEIPTGLLKIKIPHKYGITVMIAFRMLPLISQKIKSIVDAQKARGAILEFSIKNFFKLPSRLMALMVPVLYSTLEISVKISDALISRGYNPKRKITIPLSKIGRIDIIVFSVSIIVLLISFIKL